MRHRPLIALPLALALLAAAPGAGAQAVREVKKATHGAWDVICAEGQDVCVMRQVGKDAKGQDVIAVTIRVLKDVKAENGQPVPAIMNIVTPIGVSLRAGVRVKIDDGEERAAPFDVCQPNACLLASPIGDEFLGALRGGSSATLTIVPWQQQPISVNISLKGFTKAYNDLD